MATTDIFTRKPVDLLTPKDFTAFPVWEYATGEEGIAGRDETWVRPVAAGEVPHRGCVFALADFTAACGRRLAGYATISTLDGDPECCQGAVFADEVCLFVSNAEAMGYVESRGELLAGIGLSEAEMFPLAFQLRVPVAGRPGLWSGVLP